MRTVLDQLRRTVGLLGSEVPDSRPSFIGLRVQRLSRP